MKLITRDTDYAVRALCFIAKNKGKVVSAARLVEELKVPRPFLRKILQALNKNNILESFKGSGGGFILKRKPQDIFLAEVMKVFQGSFVLNECFLKKIVCPHTRCCPLKRKINRIEDYVRKELSSATIASLLK